MAGRTTRAATALAGCMRALTAAAGTSSASAAEEAGNPFNCGVDLLSPNGAQANCGLLPSNAQVRVEIRCDGFWSDYDRLSARYNVLQPV